jgi:2'-5' RNA ligase
MIVGSAERWRVFCAIELPDRVREKLVEQIKRLREAVPEAHASWSRVENIHLTLKFIGEITQHSVEAFSNAGARTIKGFSPFSIVVEQTGVFPKHGPPRVLWIGVTDESEKLADLQARLEEECAIEGFSKEERPFNPHLTLARLRKPQAARDLAEAHNTLGFEPVEVNVTELLMIRSELGSVGSKYTVISRHPLGG